MPEEARGICSCCGYPTETVRYQLNSQHPEGVDLCFICSHTQAGNVYAFFRLETRVVQTVSWIANLFLEILREGGGPAVQDVLDRIEKEG